MALTDDNMVMPVAPMYGSGYGNGGLFGGNGDSWLGILFLIALCNGGWGGFGGFGGGFGAMMGMDGFGLYPWLNNSQNINDGFKSQGIATQVNGIQNAITSGFGDVQTALCGGFAGTTAAVTGAQNALAQQMYGNEINNLERSFAAQTAATQGMNAIQAQLAQCCYDNRAATADVKYTIATENCADRAAISDGIRDILAATQAQTQAILSQMCNDKIEQKNDTIAQLRSELLYARGQEGQRALANEVEQYVAPKPIPAYYVQNPNCCTGGCGCGA